VVARTHKTLTWERTRQVQRLLLREYFPAALEAFADLDAPDALEVRGKAPDPATAARLTLAQISAALSAPAAGTPPIRPPSSCPRCAAPSWASRRAVTSAYAVTVRSRVAVIIVLNEQIETLQRQVEADFGRHPTLRSTCPSPACDPSSAPGSSASPAMTPAGTPPARPARTMRAPPRSPAHPGRKWLPPASSATTGSPTR
jgi:hypothetical protein